MEEGLCVRVPLATAGCVALWIIAAGLLCWDTANGGGLGPQSQWALMVAAAAAAWTVCLSRARERQRIVRAIRRAWAEEQLETLVR